MKKIILALVSLVLLSTLCGAVVTASYDDEVIIGLDSNPSTGYSWEANFNENKIQLIDHWYQEPSLMLQEANQGMPGVEYFRFKLLRSWARVTMEYKRSWEDEVIVRRVFYIR